MTTKVVCDNCGEMLFSNGKRDHFVVKNRSIPSCSGGNVESDYCSPPCVSSAMQTIEAQLKSRREQIHTEVVSAASFRSVRGLWFRRILGSRA